jgi:hypothetical protein
LPYRIVQKYLTSLFQQNRKQYWGGQKNADLVYDIDKQLAVSHKQKLPWGCRQIIIKWCDRSCKKDILT